MHGETIQAFTVHDVFKIARFTDATFSCTDTDMTYRIREPKLGK